MGMGGDGAMGGLGSAEDEAGFVMPERAKHANSGMDQGTLMKYD